MMVDFCYIYAIVRRVVPIPQQLTGFANAPLSTIAWQDLAAVISRVLSTTLPTASEYLLGHEAVVEALGQAGPTLPARFGTILAGTAVTQAIASQYEELLGDLVRVGDKVELGLTILWDTLTGQTLAHAKQQTISVRETPASSTSGAGMRYLEARLAHYQRETIRQDQVRRVIACLEPVLRPYVLEQRYRIFSSPRLAVRAAYLVQPWHYHEIRRIVDDMRENLPDLRWLLSGPWPPYSFVSGAGKQFPGTAGLKLDDIRVGERA
jgi:hypothetical protein